MLEPLCHRTPDNEWQGLLIWLTRLRMYHYMTSTQDFCLIEFIVDCVSNRTSDRLLLCSKSCGSHMFGYFDGNYTKSAKEVLPIKPETRV